MDNQKLIKTALIKTALIKTIPVMLGYIPIGIAFGFLMVKSGFPWFLSVIMSVLIYSGAGQFLAIEFFVNNSPFIDVIIGIVFDNFSSRVSSIVIVIFYSS